MILLLIGVALGSIGLAGALYIQTSFCSSHKVTTIATFLCILSLVTACILLIRWLVLYA